MFRNHRWLWCFALTAFASCEGGSAGENGTFLGRDSAGVTIVEHQSLPALETWSLSEEPDLVIGSAFREGPDLFGGISHLVELQSGDIVLADWRARELRAFSTTGMHLWTAGGSGQGPGEFGSIAALAVLPDDSVLAADGRTFSIFDSSGAFVRRFELSPPSDSLIVAGFVGALPDGRLVMKLIDNRPEPFGRSRGVITIAYYGKDGVFLQAVEEIAADERVKIEQPNGHVQGVAIWGRRTEIATAAGSVVATAQETFEVRRFNSSGQLDLILRVKQPPLVADASVRSCLGVTGESPHLPETLPAIGRLRMDSARRIWVEEYVPPCEDREPSWFVFGPDGSFMARVSIPDQFTMHQIGPESVLGVGSDSLDVSYVQRRLVRTE